MPKIHNHKTCTCNPCIGGQRKQESKFKVSQGYKAACPKQNKTKNPTNHPQNYYNLNQTQVFPPNFQESRNRTKECSCFTILSSELLSFWHHNHVLDYQNLKAQHYFQKLYVDEYFSSLVIASAVNLTQIQSLLGRGTLN